MPSANKTEFLGLNQWAGNEYPKREDFVDDNKKIDDKMKELDSLKADKTDLDNINIPVQSVNGKTGDVVLSATDIKASDGKTLEQANTQMDNLTQDLNTHTGDNTKHITSTERNNWNGKLDASNYTATDVLSKLKTVDGSGSGLDADMLDGKHASDFYTRDEIHNNERIERISCSQGGQIWLLGSLPSSDGSVFIEIERAHDYSLGSPSKHYVYVSTRNGSCACNWKSEGDASNYEKVYIKVAEQVNGNFNIYVVATDYANSKIRISPAGYYTHLDCIVSPITGTVIHDTSGTENMLSEFGSVYSEGHKVWHAGNDGSGSGLDADTVDGWQFYRDISELGLTAGTETINLILEAMPDKSIFITGIGSSHNSSEYPVSHGTLKVFKIDRSRTVLEFDAHSGTPRKWIGNYYITQKFSGWEETFTAGSKPYVTGSYIGDGNTSRFINLGFTPSAVYLNNKQGSVKYTSATARDYHYGGLAILGSRLELNSSYPILEIVTNGFNIFHTNSSDDYVRTNESGVIYNYIAYK